MEQSLSCVSAGFLCLDHGSELHFLPGTFVLRHGRISCILGNISLPFGVSSMSICGFALYLYLWKVTDNRNLDIYMWKIEQSEDWKPYLPFYYLKTILFTGVSYQRSLAGSGCLCMCFCMCVGVWVWGVVIALVVMGCSADVRPATNKFDNVCLQLTRTIAYNFFNGKLGEGIVKKHESC